MQRNASRVAKSEQPIWQRRFWGHVIRNQQDFAVHVDYIHYNPAWLGESGARLALFEFFNLGRARYL